MATTSSADEVEQEFSDEAFSSDEDELDDASELAGSDCLSTDLPCRTLAGMSKRTYGMLATDSTEVCRRSRRRRLDEHLLDLRAVVPEDPAARRSSVIDDANRYIKELTRRVTELSSELLESELQIHQKSQQQVDESAIQEDDTSRRDNNCIAQPLVRPFMASAIQVKVFSRQAFLHVHVSCGKCPGLLVAVLEILEKAGLDVMQASVACHNQFIFDALATVHEQQVKAEEVRGTILKKIAEGMPRKAK